MMMSIFKDEPLNDVVGKVVDEMLLAVGCELHHIFTRALLVSEPFLKMVNGSDVKKLCS